MKGANPPWGVFTGEVNRRDLTKVLGRRSGCPGFLMILVKKKTPLLDRGGAVARRSLRRGGGKGRRMTPPYRVLLHGAPS